MIPFDSPASDVSDAHPELLICETPLRQYGGKPVFGGPIRTLKCLDDTALLMRVLGEPGQGAVLVVDGEGSLRCALLGDRHAGMAARNGWNGVVVYGAVRDTVGLAQLELGVKAVGSTPRRSGKSGLGAVDVPVRFGGAVFEPGGHLWSDADGIVVAPAGWESDSLEPIRQTPGFAH
jgi:regulator of ribonuclease activity A